MKTLEIRRASATESDEAASLVIRSRHADVSTIPHLIHSNDEVLEWFQEVVMANQQVWVAVVEQTLIGTLVLTAGWIEQLYVDPLWMNQGVGTALLGRAKQESPDGLELWTFESNVGAQRFYERHGFTETDRTSGDNEEGAPDIKFRWTPRE
ncbi:MAG: GNAT family N-acetyltransferase [Acidimicrobiales bacterium]